MMASSKSGRKPKKIENIDVSVFVNNFKKLDELTKDCLARLEGVVHGRVESSSTEMSAIRMILDRTMPIKIFELYLQKHFERENAQDWHLLRDNSEIRKLEPAALLTYIQKVVNSEGRAS